MMQYIVHKPLWNLKSLPSPPREGAAWMVPELPGIGLLKAPDLAYTTGAF
jgi:hypothetical protein